MYSWFSTSKDSLFHCYHEVCSETYTTTRSDTVILRIPHNTTTKKEGIDTNLEAKVLGKNFVFLSGKYSIKHFILFLPNSVSYDLIYLFYKFLNL